MVKLIDCPKCKGSGKEIVILYNETLYAREYKRTCTRCGGRKILFDTLENNVEDAIR